MPWIIGVPVALMALLFLLTFILAQRLVNPSRRLFTDHPTNYEAPHELVRFPSPRGTIAAWYLPGVNGRTLIALHGIGDNRQQWLAPAVELQKRGYGTLLVDFHSHGESSGAPVTYGDHETQDVAAALDYLRERGDVDMSRVGVMGLSLGGITAIIAASRLPVIRAVVAEAAFSDLKRDLEIAFHRFTGIPAFPFAPLTIFWAQILTGAKLSRLRPAEVVGTIAPRPILIIGDLKDALVNEPHASETLFARAGEPKELWQVAEAGHVKAYLIEGARYVDRLDTFFSRYL